MPKVRIKKDDKVLVLGGKSKGRRARVLSVDPKNGKITVEGANVVKKHTKPRPPKVPQGGILEKAMPMDASNVMLICPHCSAPIRIGYHINAAGEKERRCRKCDETIS